MKRTVCRVTAFVALCASLVLLPASASWAAGLKLTGFSPTSGIIGTKVTVNGAGFALVKSVTFNGVVSKFKVVSSSKITTSVPATATSGKISVTTSTGKVTSTATFSVLPSVSSFTPSSGVIGTVVSITGGGFTGATSVTFNGVGASFTVKSANSINATVPAGATTGTIAVTTPKGVSTTGSNFTVLPKISSFSPSSGQIGASVTITGSGFDSVSGVTFNGVTAVFVVNSSTQITATVPTTLTGPIVVTTATGSTTSANNFKVLPSITLASAYGAPGSKISISGVAFDPNAAIDIYFDGTALGLAGTDSTGSFSGLVLSTPASATPGLHTISGVERNSTNFGQTPFTVGTDWAMFRNTASHRGLNTTENVVGTANVGGLTQNWAATVNGTPTSPALVKGTMYVGSAAGTLYAFNASTGAQLWTASTTGAINASPAVVGGVAYVVSADGKLWAFDATTGAAAGGSYPVTLVGTSNSSPTVTGGIVYLGTTSNAYAIDATSGTVDWTSAPGTGSMTGTSPAVANGVAVFTTSTGRAIAYTADATGGLLWNVAFGGSQLTTPMIVSGVVYFGSTNGNAYAGSLASGAGVWTNFIGSAFNSAPSYENGQIFMGNNDGNVYAFDTAGNNPWGNGNGTAYRSPIAVANGVVYAGSDDFGIYAFDSSNGNMLWSAKTNGQVRSSPVIVNGMLYVPSNDLHVYAYDLVTP